MTTDRASLSRLRKAHGLALREAAARCDIDPAYLWKLEKRAVSNPGLKVAAKIKAAFELTWPRTFLLLTGQSEEDFLLALDDPGDGDSHRPQPPKQET